MYFPTIDFKKYIADPHFRKVPFWYFYLTGFLVLFASPDNVLDTFPILKFTANYISYVIPSIDIWVIGSDSPQKTQLFFAYAWIGMPLETITYINIKTYEDSFAAKMNEESLRVFRHIFLFIFLGILFLTSVFTPFYFIGIIPKTTLLEQAIAGGLMPMMASLSIAYLIFWVRLLKSKLSS